VILLFLATVTGAALAGLLAALIYLVAVAAQRAIG